MRTLLPLALAKPRASLWCTLALPRAPTTPGPRALPPPSTCSANPSGSSNPSRLRSLLRPTPTQHQRRRRSSTLPLFRSLANSATWTFSFRFGPRRSRQPVSLRTSSTPSPGVWPSTPPLRCSIPCWLPYQAAVPIGAYPRNICCYLSGLGPTPPFGLRADPLVGRHRPLLVSSQLFRPAGRGLPG